MESWSWQWLVLAVVIGLVALIAYAPDPTAENLSTLSNQQLVELLSSPREVVRHAAAGQLLHRAKTIVPTLFAAARHADASRYESIITLLEELFLSADENVANAAEIALEDLAALQTTDRSDAAQRVLQNNANLRHARALAQVTSLGARTMAAYSGDTRQNTAGTAGAAGTAASLASNRWFPQTNVVMLDEHWRGGDAGLRLVARLFPFEGALALHLTRDTPVSADGLKLLRTTYRPRISIRWQDESCLGVMTGNGPDEQTHEMRLSAVVAGSPAELAGLQTGDVLTEYAGQPIRHFNDLLRIAATFRPGDRVELRYLRGRQAFRAKVVLGSDFGTGVCHCVDSESDQ